MLRKILLLLLLALIVIQFIHPKRNLAKEPQVNNIANRFTVPGDVKEILGKACLDCHSNNTRYPWYTKFQPFDWWITHHINEGKAALNFDEYTNKSLRYQFHKMEEVAEMVKDGKMPLNSYLWIHKDAKLTADEKSKLISWTESIQDTMKAIYPADSLIRPKKKPGS
jgi:hypothetical protein